jgi:hypothetical protein
MQAFIDFLVNNYLWFLGISLILLFALIGYLVDTNEKKENVNIDDINEENDNIQENTNVNVNVEQDNNETEILDDLE